MTADPQDQLQRALAIIEKLQSKLAQAQVSEPIAVVGMACRFPGANSPQEFWRLLEEGREATGPVPPERWEPGPHIAMTRGGFLDQVDQFDAQFFNISPREAESLDPQQRLLLEVTWEALEGGGIRPASLRGSQGAVYVGVGANDYGQLRLYGNDPAAVEVYDGTGNSLSFVSGRISYALGLHGPSLNLVTACSSSLVGVHLAVQSLQRDECDLAICAGVHLMLTPDNCVFLSRTQALSASGHCYAFDARAEGFVRAEGCGVVLLKRLSQARRDGNQILAVVRGSGVNNDGPSAGFTAPNGEAQRRLLSQVLQRSGARPEEVGFLECHGTATVLGDPIEVDAIGHVYGRCPLVLGSLKANVGHLEAAAGVASLIKAVLVLQHQTIPPQINFATPNPHIAWDQLALSVNRAAQPLPPDQLVGVSGFGMSGTNAHLLLAPAPPVETRREAAERTVTLPLSARSPQALRQLAQLYLERVHEENWCDLCACAATRRDALEYRLAVVASSAEELRQRLRDFLEGRSSTTGRKPHSPRVAFLFTGQGSHYPHMGLELSQSEPQFKPANENLSAAELARTEFAQPALFSLQILLAQMLRGWGVEPAALLGHSLGEFSAACLAGVFTPEQALEVVRRRGQRMQSLTGDGVMTAVWAAPETLDLSEVSLAARNAPEICVVSGPREAVERLERGLKVKHRRLEVSQAFHSAQMDPILEALGEDASGARPPQLALVSSLTGKWAGPDMATPAYWARQARQPVQFLEAMAQLDQLGIDIFLEIGPRPHLLAQGRLCLPESRAAWIPTLKPEQSEALCLQETLAQLFVAGVDINWDEVWRHHPYQVVDLPTYPWQRQRYWLGQAPRKAPLPAYSLNWHELPPLKPVAQTWRVVGPGAALLAPHLKTDEQARNVVFVAAGSDLEAAHLCAQAAEVMRSGARVSIVTAQAVTVSPDDPSPLPQQTALWGLGRAFALEQPENWGGLLDVGESWAGLAQSLGAPEKEVALRQGRRYGCRLLPLALAQRQPQLDPAAFYLITGAGGLGLEAAHSLADWGARRIIVLSRQTRPQTRLQELQQRGVEVRQIACDVAELGASLEGLGPIKGVIHTAAALADGVVHNLTRESFDTVFRPKLAGALSLAEATRQHPLDFFLLYSSAAALLGNRGQANYCAANAALDGLAERLRGQGIPASVLHWGPWGEVGMASRLSQVHQARMREQGLEPFLPHQCTQLLAPFLSRPSPLRVALIQVDWERYHRAEAPTLSATLTQAEPDQRLGLVRAHVSQLLVKVLRLDSQEIEPGRGFFHMGMDSLMAAELTGLLRQTLELPLPASLVFDESDLNSLSQALLEMLFPEDEDEELALLIGEKFNRLVGGA